MLCRMHKRPSIAPPLTFKMFLEYGRSQINHNEL